MTQILHSGSKISLQQQL